MSINININQIFYILIKYDRQWSQLLVKWTLFQADESVIIESKQFYIRFKDADCV